MRIVIDARMYGPTRWTGIGRYLQQLLIQLEATDHQNEYIVLIGDENFVEYVPRATNFTKLRAPYRPYSFGEQLGLAGLLYRLKPDLVHFPAPNAPVLYFGRHVTTIHDLTLLYHRTSRYTGARRRLQGYKQLPFRLVLWTMARLSSRLLTPTEYVKQQLVSRYQLPASKVIVAMLSFDPSLPTAEPIDRFKLTPGYLLHVGNCYPYKNVDRLIDAFASLITQSPDLRLVLVGRDDYFRNRLRTRVEELKLSDRVIFTGSVTDGELESLYQQAGLYINPSISEGFGLQGLEAMIQQTPVLAARASCLPEVYGDAAAYFDPSSTEDLTTQLTSLLSDPAKLDQLRRAGTRHVKDFSWEKMAAETLSVYKQTLSK